MSIWLKKHPDPATLYSLVKGETNPGDGYEQATELEAQQWGVAQLAGGWTPSGVIGMPIIESDEHRIARIHGESDAVYSTLPLTVQAMFAPIYVAVKDAIARDQLELAAAIVSAQQVPSELESAKAAILATLAT